MQNEQVLTVANECLHKAYAVYAQTGLHRCLRNLRRLHGSLRLGHNLSCGVPTLWFFPDFPASRKKKRYSNALYLKLVSPVFQAMKPWAQCDEPVVAFDLANLSALMTQISSVLCSSVGYVDRRSVPHKSICPPPTATLAASWEVAALEPSHRLLAQQNVAADDEVSSSRTVEHPNLSTARPNLLRT